MLIKWAGLQKTSLSSTVPAASSAEMGESELNESKGHSAGGMLQRPNVHGLQDSCGSKSGSC